MRTVTAHPWLVKHMIVHNWQPVLQKPVVLEPDSSIKHAHHSAVLCCAVLCCAVLCCAVLCCAVLCCAVPDFMQGPAALHIVCGTTFVVTDRATTECCTLLTLKPRCRQNPIRVPAFNRIHANPWGVTASGGLHPPCPHLMSRHPVSFLSSCFWHPLTALLSSSLKQWWVEMALCLLHPA